MLCGLDRMVVILDYLILMEINNAVNKVKRIGGYTGKMIVVGFLVLICWIGSLVVLGVVSERQNRESEVAREVAEQWGRPQLVAGPIIAVPLLAIARTPNGEYLPKTLYILPKELSIKSDIRPELRTRGIFSAPVYRADLELAGSFAMPNLAELGIAPGMVRWDKAVLVVGFSDTRNITAQDTKWNNATITLNPGAELWNVNGMGVHAPIVWAPSQIEQKFDLKISVAGSKGISFLPLGDATSVSASAPWGSPSFGGAYLPASEDLQKDHFSASWQVSALGRSYPSAWEGSGSGIRLTTYDYNNNYSSFFDPAPTTKSIQVNSGSGENYERALASSAFGVNLFREVTFYTLVSRTVKYAILFIALTFLAFYLFEIIASIKVHPFQYLLIGASLVLFYLLLLSLSEQIGFGWAYLLSTVMTLGLVTTYSASVLKAHKRAWQVTAILAVLYAYLYSILQLENYALLFGTLFLFVALAGVMRVTRTIDWYSKE